MKVRALSLDFHKDKYPFNIKYRSKQRIQSTDVAMYFVSFREAEVQSVEGFARGTVEEGYTISKV